jgi:hypothetical protein|tara:strand:- start:565 stop:1032 length:468 start_codon:yes stop_codon:yes gene_type:complete
MAKLEDKVNEILGIESIPEATQPKEFQPPVERPKGDVEVKTEKDINQDYAYSRDSYYNLIDKGNEAIEGILEIAKEGQHPRAYEVAGQLLGQVAGTVDKLQDLQKKLKDLKQVPKTANTNVKNALFVGSTAELQKMLNRKQEDETIEKNITPEKE